VTGEARYVDDMPSPAGTLHALPVPSEHAHARLLAVDARDAMAVPGVVDVIVASDLVGENNVGPVFHDEPVLAGDTIHCVGMPVAIVVGTSLEACRRGVALVRVEVEELAALVDLDEAIEAGSFIGEPHVISRGVPDARIAAAPIRLSGEVRSGGQDHFYLESHCAVAIPGEGDTLTIHSSTQHPSEVQTLVAAVLGWGRHQVVVTCGRMGGAFGGKETQAAQFACMAAVGSVRQGRPVKVWLDRDTDMLTTGRRHPFRTRWQAGADEDGTLVGLVADLVSDGGWAADLSLAIVDRGLFHVDNAYFLSDVRLTGRVARTHKTSNTAFRGFGGPQGMVVIEHIMERVAAAAGLDPLEVRRRNLYAEGQTTPYGQKVEGFRLPRMIDELASGADLEARRIAVSTFNRDQVWRKRGLALTPVKFGISFTASFLNQAGAFLLLYADGTLQLNHGGTEMGQGLYTKMLAVAAHTLGVDLGRIRHMDTSTDKVPNTSATAASSGSDLNGAAVRDAASVLVGRLRAVAARMLGVGEDAIVVAADGVRPRFDGEWAWCGEGRGLGFAEICGQAYLDQTSLAVTGFYRTPDIAYDRTAGRGKPFHYFAYGVALSEVEVDGLTGEWRLLRVDVVHDVGDSLSPDIDLGQVEGAYIQGLGWLTCEELVFDGRGGLISHSPSTYKIPAIGDAPVQFNVRLLQDATQPDVVLGSKAVGEPPFMLAISAHAALSRAASAFVAGDVALPMPATTEAILMSIEAARGADSTQEAGQ